MISGPLPDFTDKHIVGPCPQGHLHDHITRIADDLAPALNAAEAQWLQVQRPRPASNASEAI